MDELVSKQTSLGKEIEKICNKYRNDAPERKTIVYLQENLKHLQKLWDEFDKNDDKIRQIQPQATTHLYFEKDYYNIVSNGYQSIVAEMKELLNHQTAQNPKVTEAGLTISNPPEPQCSTSKIGSDNTLSGCNTTETAAIISLAVTNNSITVIRKQFSLISALNNILNGVIVTPGNLKSYYELKINTINKYWNQIENNHQVIWTQIPNPEIYEYNDQIYFKIENRVQEVMAELLKCLELIQISSNQNQAVSIANDTAHINNTSTTQSLMKLPKIVLPKFNGNYLNWQQFHDLYTQMVHNQPLSNPQKMWYLKSNLIGEAEKLIKHLSVSEENYNTAWEILNQRYNNKRLIVTSLIDKLLSQPSITTESAAALKNIHDNTKECLLSLENLGLKVMNYWDPLIIHIVTKKLDRNTHALYEQTLKAPRELQNIENFLKFLETRFQSLEALGNKPNNKIVEKPKISALMTNSIKTGNCLICKEKHAIYQCNEFLKLTASERQRKALQLDICLNCLKKGHTASKCTSRSCLKCNKRHNTLLHFNSTAKSGNPSQTNTANVVNMSSSSANHQINNSTNVQTSLAANSEENMKSYVFLGTAIATVKNKNGDDIKCRILLDSGSQLNFITEKLKKKLRMSNVEIPINISGIGKSQIKVNNRVNITINSLINNYSSQLEAYVIKEIAAYQPQRYVQIDKWNIPSNIKLADPEFNKPQEIDILLGAELYGELMRSGQIKLDKHLPILQNTVLGWTVLGKASIEENDTMFCGITNLELEKNLQKFWDLEEYVEKPQLSITDQKCEEYFDATATRDGSGRFIVSLPILGNTELLRNSEAIAFKRLLSIEKKLSKDATLKQQYSDFLDEYLKLGHMEEIKREKIGPTHYFLPHHYVLKPGSSTTKLRVVFDASAKTNSNLSLNDLMLAGPKIQDDLISIILRFRMKKYVFTADVKQMYRQIQVTEEDRNLQLIMWRTNPSEAVKYYRLCTVTYGTKSAPYLAVKCLQRLAEEEESRYPLGSKAVRNFYVDDVMTGSNDIIEAIKIQTELQELLKSGGLELHKWCANHPELIKNIPRDKLELQLQFHEKDDSHIKTLGLLWHPITDHFGITTEPKPHQRITKRNILSDTAQIYDPLGLINPVVVTSKIFLQDLWKLKLDWDDELPEELQAKWAKFIQEVPKLTSVQVPRYMFGNKRTVSTQLHVFCDASEKAYGAVTYIRSKDENGIITIRLLCSKSRVAPVKPTTLPRLELCGAKLAANLVDRITKTIEEKLDEIIYWTDSQIVLSWIRGDPARLKTFVANRISNILESSSPKQWRYVPSKSNPADLISRGTLPNQLIESKLWFSGPEFLQNSRTMWPQNKMENVTLKEEEKTLKFALNASTAEPLEHPLYKINHGNSFTKLVRVMAYIRRAINYMKNKTHTSDKFLTTKELEEATRDIIKEIQQKSFEDDIKVLKKQNQVKTSSKLLNLSPFLDEHGLLRVGGRIEEANISYDAKHPLLLPGDHFISKLIYSHLHNINLHAGPQALNSIVRQKYWILQGRNLSRSTVANCTRCTRLRPRLMNQVMGNLPPNRVQQARPFYNCGVDFCGPVYTHFKIRGKRPLKSYIAVFCCFATKATHLEVVSDLTTEGFIAALKRFIARRGKCQKIFCDNAKNFVGAKNQLGELQHILNNHKSIEKIKNTVNTHNIEFKFIPPRAPHFGGLWEAAVKSTKMLLYRSVASASLTYEELCTVTAEIEAILNSRPLTAISSDPNDLSPLTPAHFIIGEPMTANPDPFAMQSRMSLASRWALVSQIRAEFWKRWSTEYLHLLQQRAKWAKEYPNILPGALVLVKEDNLPPLKWQMGRVIETIEGPDGKVRVADVKTATGTYRRAIHYLAPLIAELNYETDMIAEDCEPTNPKIDTKNQEKQDEEEGRRQSRKRRNSRQGAMNCLKVLLLTSIIMPVLTTNIQPVEVTSLDNQSGVYFEKIGNAMITGSEWKIIVYYNLTNYWTALKTLEQGINGMKRLASTIKNNDYQREIVEEYQHQLIELKAYNQLFMNETQQTREVRFKRSKSPLNFIGSTFRALIGVLDEDYAEEMSQTIDKAKQNEDHLLKLIQNQTSVIETTINIMKKSEGEKIQQMKFIEENTEKLYDKIRNINIDMKQSKAVEGFNVLSLLCSALLQDYKNKQSSILDIITATQHGKLNPLILTPEQLISQLRFIRNHIQSPLQLPFTIDGHTLLNAYRLINVQYRLREDYAIFLATVPLVRETKFELYKIYPLPAHINNNFISLETRTDYILISAHRDRFYRLTELDLLKGTQINDEMYLIHQKGPIYNKNAQQNCELQLFTQFTLPSSCKLKITQPARIWIQLETLNHWLFSLDKKYIITFVC